MSSVHARRTISVTTTALLLASAACTQSGSTHPKSLPKPKENQVIVLAGNGTAGKPEPGVFSTNTPLTNPNAMALSVTDGALFVAADTESQEAIVRIGADGRVSVLDSDLPGPMRAMEIADGIAWALWPTPARDAASYSALYRQPISGGESTELFGGYGTKVPLMQVDSDGNRSPYKVQQELSKAWYPMGIAVSSGRPPVVALYDGHLYEALGGSKVRRFAPHGYGAALRAAGGKFFSTFAMTSDQKGGFVVLGTTGAIWVSADGTARGIRFQSQVPSAVYKGWYKEWGAVVLGNDELLITSQGKLYLVKSDGAVSQIPTGSTVNCRATKSISEFGIPARTRLTRLADNTIAISAVSQCNRVYAFRPPRSW